MDPAVAMPSEERQWGPVHVLRDLRPLYIIPSGSDVVDEVSDRAERRPIRLRP